MDGHMGNYMAKGMGARDFGERAKSLGLGIREQAYGQGCKDKGLGEKT